MPRKTAVRPASDRTAEPSRLPEQPQIQPAQVYTAVHSLLHTMRVIQQHEDQLCTLMHEMHRTGKISTRLRAELDQLLHQIPCAEFSDDLCAIRRALD